jgi:hypothetical protein
VLMIVVGSVIVNVTCWGPRRARTWAFGGGGR